MIKSTKRASRHVPSTAILLSAAALVSMSLAFTATPALAAAPEAPSVVTVQLPVGATRASVEGFLNPKAEGHFGSYEFLYNKASSGECENGAHAPESPGMMLGFENERVAETLLDLEPSAEYMVCLLARNDSGGETVGPAVTFTTERALETPETTNPATGITSSSATLHGVLNPGAKAEPGERYEFVYRVASTSCQGPGSEASGGSALGEKEEAVHAEITTGLLPGATYTFCLVARNEAGEEAVGPTVTFTTLAEPATIAGESASELGPSTVTLSAEIDPGGAPTGYRVQYVTDAHFKEKGFSEPSEAPAPPAAEASAGSTSTTVTVHRELTGLQAGVEYHYRFVARNAAGPVAEGAVEAFATPLPPESSGLPDGRVYEKVTPSENYDADVYVPLGLPIPFTTNSGEFDTKLPFQVAPNGEAVAFVASPTIDGTGHSGLGLGDEYLARRAARGGWEAPTNLQPLGQNGEFINSAFYQAFSPDLTTGVIQSGSFREAQAPALSSPAPGKGYAVLYARSLADNSYAPFFRMDPSLNPAAFATHDVPTTSFTAPSGLAFAGASETFNRLFFEANGSFTGTGAVDGGATQNNLYQSDTGEVSLVNVLPGGGSDANATFGAEAFDEPEDNPPDFSNVISEDGARVFWTDLNTNVVYLRENADQPESPLGPHDECLVSSDACTVQVSAGQARYWAASTDGKYAFYTEGEGEESELYRFDVGRGPTGTSEVLTDPKAGVQGVVGVSQDGSMVYFVAQGKLAENKNSDGAEAETGAYNLYMLNGSVKPVFVAQLSENDGIEAIKPLRHLIKNTGDWQPGVGHRTAEVTPDGNSLVFMSNDQSVDGHVEEVGGVPLEEVYVYDAGDGVLSCASCGGERGIAPGETPESERGLGAVLPISNQLTYQPTLISEDGSRVFFDSDEPLVPTDTNSEQDVYEWERDGSGGCRESDGCVYLLSGGAGTTSSWLVGADATGENAFFVTRAQLVPEDKNENYDLYDARVNGMQAVAPPACTGTGCQGAPSPPPTFATPPSGTYEGVGDFPPPAPAVVKPKPKAKPAKCKRGHIKHHNKCVKAKARKKAARAKRAGRDRGGKS